ncbi:MAG: polyprenol monophosphomannose synthase [Chloroflexi bacterium]|nr:polyprenol monophosphomannose synthase [Chloroflexota bacterium]
MTVAVVVPTYNEAEVLPEFVHQLFSLSIPDLQLIVVDDSSPDGTGKLAESLSINHGGNIKVLHRRGKLGLGTAYVQGFQYALKQGADYIIQMDADLSHSPEYIPAFLQELKKVEVVIGSRYVPGGGLDKKWGMRRRALSYLGNLYIRLASGIKVKDATSGFKGFRSYVLSSLDWSKFKCKGFAFQAEMAYACERKKFRIDEYGITFAERASGRSKISINIVIEALWRFLPLRWSRKSG